MKLLVDGMNVIGSRPDGWWHDREGAARSFIARLQRLAIEADEDLEVVLDGFSTVSLPAGNHSGVLLLYSERTGPNAADDRIVSLVESAECTSEIQVITSDRELQRRVRLLGAKVAGTSYLLDRLDAIDA